MELNSGLIKELKHRAARIRWLSIKTTAEAGSGHPSTCCSAADILSVLFFHVMRYDPQYPESPANDRLVLSKGHAAPALYAAWCEAGYLDEAELYTLRKINSRIEGHPMPYLPFVDVATGSLGQGLSVGVGISLHQTRVVKNGARTFVLLGDGELAEGSIWEAMSLAAHLKIDNLVAIADINRLGQSCETMHGHDLTTYAKKVEAFGWEAMVVDGHDIGDLVGTFERALRVKGKPVCLLAKTFKGRGVSFMENQDGWHGKPVKPGPELEKALNEVSVDLMKAPPRPSIARPTAAPAMMTGPVAPQIGPAPFAVGAKVATRQAVGDALTALGKVEPRIWTLDADTGNSTYTDRFFKVFPERSIQCYIAEQNMAGIAAGLAARGLVPFACTFGAFLTRAFDQIRMAALSGLKVKFLGTHAGVSIGEDGPSQMALEDIAAFRTLPNGMVMYPSDAVSAYWCIVNLARHDGPGYVRLSRPATPVLYKPDEPFMPGDLKVHGQKTAPALTVVTAGVVVHEALKALESLGADCPVQIVDAYSIRPFPVEKLSELVTASNGRVLILEEHSPCGGLGEATASALAGKIQEFHHVAVDKVPRSGSPDEMLESFGLSAKTIAAKIRSLLY